jgi:hypothetical protein
LTFLQPSLLLPLSAIALEHGRWRFLSAVAVDAVVATAAAIAATAVVSDRGHEGNHGKGS